MAVDSSKTEKATPKKRKDEQKKGNIFQSRDVVSAFSILALFWVLKLIFPYIYYTLCSIFRAHIGYVKTIDELSITHTSELIRNAGIAIILLAGPVMLVSVAIGILATGIQTKFKISKEQIKFKFSRLSPIQGVKRLFSLRSITELLKAIIKISIIIAVLYFAYKKIFGKFMKLMYQDIFEAVSFILNSLMDIVLQLSLAFIAIAAFDYLYQWWEYERNLRMSKQEVKEEYKQLEGDPQIKGRIKEKQRTFAMQRMIQQVPTADVVIRNPTHIAVALRYNLEKDNAPIVVAKGQDYLALRIVEIAQQNNIPTTENKPLARALYSAVDVNREIPPEYYTALAEVLAWVYSMKKETGEY